MKSRDFEEEGKKMEFKKIFFFRLEIEILDVGFLLHIHSDKITKLRPESQTFTLKYERISNLLVQI